jgi:hypothetical protein
VITASIGLGASVLIFLLSLLQHDLTAFIALGLITFLIGIGIVINGFVFTIPRKKIADRSDEAASQRELESNMPSAEVRNQLSAVSSANMRGPKSTDPIAGRPSVTEHTTHQLKPNKS